MATDTAEDPGQPRKPVYVWRSLGEPGEYALCTDPSYPDFQNANWQFLGELRDVPALAIVPRRTVDNKTVGGWAFRLRVTGPNQFMY